MIIISHTNTNSGVPLGSILRPLLFNIYICDVFEAPRNIAFAGYADNNGPYTYSSGMQTVLNNLKEAIEKLFQWFSANYFLVNANKCHLLTSSKTATYISDATVSNVIRVKLLGLNL